MKNRSVYSLDNFYPAPFRPVQIYRNCDSIGPGEIAVKRNKFYWKVDNITRKYRKFSYIPVNTNDQWEYISDVALKKNADTVNKFSGNKHSKNKNGSVCSSALLFKIDELLNKFSTELESFGAGHFSYMIPGNRYIVICLGNMICVKINDVVPDSEYNKLCSELNAIYANNNAINSIYICKVGTVIIKLNN